MAQMVEHLPGKSKALSSNTTTAKKNLKIHACTHWSVTQPYKGRMGLKDILLGKRSHLSTPKYLSTKGQILHDPT
jgi:hypothetical protein